MSVQRSAPYASYAARANAPVRGMIALVPGSIGDGRVQATGKFWQDLADELGFGLIACLLKNSTNGGAGYCYAAKGSCAALVEAFGKEHLRPEMKTVPLLLWGHSAGGQFNYNFACWKPQRTLGFVVNKRGFYYDTPCTTATCAVPAMLFIGGKDTEVRIENITKLFDDNRARGALWAMCVEPDSDHGVGSSREVTRTGWATCRNVRSPQPANLKEIFEKQPGFPTRPQLTRGWLWCGDAKKILASVYLLITQQTELPLSQSKRAPTRREGCGLHQSPA